MDVTVKRLLWGKFANAVINFLGINQKNYEEHLIGVREINWSYPKELIEESSKADIVFSY